MWRPGDDHKARILFVSRICMWSSRFLIIDAIIPKTPYKVNCPLQGKFLALYSTDFRPYEAPRKRKLYTAHLFMSIPKLCMLFLLTMLCETICYVCLAYLIGYKHTHQASMPKLIARFTCEISFLKNCNRPFPRVTQSSIAPQNPQQWFLSLYTVSHVCPCKTLFQYCPDFDDASSIDRATPVPRSGAPWIIHPTHLHGKCKANAIFGPESAVIVPPRFAKRRSYYAPLNLFGGRGLPLYAV